MLYAIHESNRCGTDYTIICRDLKTAKGVANRIKQSPSRPAGNWRIYSVAQENWYKDTGHKLIGTCRKEASA